MLTRFANSTVAFALCLFSCPGFSAGLVVNDRALRDDLAWLSDRKLIRLDLSTWPLSEAEIQNALLTLRASEDPVNLRVIHRIKNGYGSSNRRDRFLLLPRRVATGSRRVWTPGIPRGSRLARLSA